MLFGALDAMTPAESCEPIVGGSPRPGVVVRVYPGARHAFNFAHLAEPPPGGAPSWTPGYNRAAAKAAWDDAAAFLAR